MATFFKVSNRSYIQFIRRNISYIYVKVNEQKAVLKPFVCIYLFLKCFQNICAFSVIQMFVFIYILIKCWMIISRIDICFLAYLIQHGGSVIFTWQWTVHVEIFYVWKFDFNDSFTVLTIIVRTQYILQQQSSQKYNIESFKATQTIILIVW